MSRSSGADIFRRDQLLAMPHPLVHHQLAQLGNVLRTDIEAPAALFNAGGASLPKYVSDPHRAKEPLLEEIRELFSGFAQDDGREHVGIEAVVVKFRPRLAFQGRVKKSTHPVLL